MTAGRPSVLNDELKLKIRELVHQGKGNKEIAEIIDVPLETYEHWLWRNYQGFADAITTYRHERMLAAAESTIEKLVNSEDEKIQLGAATHITETLGKRWFSKRSELTGAEGKPLIMAGEVAEKHQIGNETPSITG